MAAISDVTPLGQYDSWVAAMAKCQSDIDLMRKVRPNFAPLLVGLHWPSLPFGNEELKANQAENGVADRQRQTEYQVELYSKRISETGSARRSLRTILTAAHSQLPPTLPPDVVNAFKTLQSEAGLRSNEMPMAPGTDCELFVPEKLYEDIREDGSRRNGGRQVGAADELANWLLQMLGVSFLLANEEPSEGCLAKQEPTNSYGRCRTAVPANRDVRFHLMGHSFGCIVASACVAGTAGRRSGSKPVHSLNLVQGALSLWSYCTDIEAGIAGPIPSRRSRGPTPGYFRRIIDERLVSGPIITTQSEFDSAVGTLYPWAAWLQKGSSSTPKPINCPSMGLWGLSDFRDQDATIKNMAIGDANVDYGFEAGKIYNIDSSRIIKETGGGASGAHSDICHAEVGHLIWTAARHEATIPSPAPTPVPPSPSPPIPSPPVPVPPSPQPLPGPGRWRRRWRILRRRRG